MCNAARSIGNSALCRNSTGDAVLDLVDVSRKLVGERPLLGVREVARLREREAGALEVAADHGAEAAVVVEHAGPRRLAGGRAAEAAVLESLHGHLLALGRCRCRLIVLHPPTSRRQHSRPISHRRPTWGRRQASLSTRPAPLAAIDFASSQVPGFGRTWELVG